MLTGAFVSQSGGGRRSAGAGYWGLGSFGRFV